MKKSGSHTSIPTFRPDKRTPKTAFGDQPLYELTPGEARAVKRHHHKKQRQLDKKLAQPEPEFICSQCKAPRDFAFDFCRACGSQQITRTEHLWEVVKTK